MSSNLAAIVTEIDDWHQYAIDPGVAEAARRAAMTNLTFVMRGYWPALRTALDRQAKLEATLATFHTDFEHGQYDCIGYSEGQECCVEKLRALLAESVQPVEAGGKEIDPVVHPQPLSRRTIQVQVAYQKGKPAKIHYDPLPGEKADRELEEARALLGQFALELESKPRDPVLIHSLIQRAKEISSPENLSAP